MRLGLPMCLPAAIARSLPSLVFLIIKLLFSSANTEYLKKPPEKVTHHSSSTPIICNYIFSYNWSLSAKGMAQSNITSPLKNQFSLILLT
jgi:hypothetical protein